MNKRQSESVSVNDSQSAFERIASLVSGHERFVAADGLVHVARSPGRLDVMGGVADYTGSRVCQMPLEIAAAAAVQQRSDGKVVCLSQQTSEQDELILAAGELAQLSPLGLRERIGNEHAWAGYVVGCLAWLMKHHPQPAMKNGATLLIDSDVPPGGGVSSSAAIEVATMIALASLYDVTLTPMTLAAACQNVENQVVGAPCGVMDQVVSCMGTHNAILEILCQSAADGMPAQLQGSLQIPKGYAFVGVHSGVRHEVRGDPYGDTRVAAFMARKMIRNMSPSFASLEYLANLPLVQYESSLRLRLPLTLLGSEFISEHDSTEDHATTITPESSYHVRDAADHHVREMHRVTRFAKLLAENGSAQTTPSEHAMIEAGQLMNQSHASYSQCARLGHPLTDQLAELLQQAGTDAGIFGCRVTGGGCGGTLAVLLRDEKNVHETLHRIRETYESQTGRRTMLFNGTSDGGSHTPVVKLAAQTRKTSS